MKLKKEVIQIILFSMLSLVSASVLSADCNSAKTADINECAREKLAVVEKKLNKTYQRVMKKLTPTGDGDDSVKKSLQIAQRLWVKYREADCDAVYDYWSSGSIRGVARITCMTDHAEIRTKQLMRYELNY